MIISLFLSFTTLTSVGILSSSSIAFSFAIYLRLFVFHTSVQSRATLRPMLHPNPFTRLTFANEHPHPSSLFFFCPFYHRYTRLVRCINPLSGVWELLYRDHTRENTLTGCHQTFYNVNFIIFSDTLYIIVNAKMLHTSSRIFWTLRPHHFPETSFHRIVVVPKRHVVECQLVESSYCRIVKLPKPYHVQCHFI